MVDVSWPVPKAGSDVGSVGPCPLDPFGRLVDERSSRRIGIGAAPPLGPVARGHSPPVASSRPMWIDDTELIDAIGQLAAATVIVRKQPRRPTDLRKLEPLDNLNQRTPGMPIRAFSALSGLAPLIDGKPALIGPNDRPDRTVVPTIRTLGWRKTGNENVPILHAKLALLGHLWWHDEDGLGMVSDEIGFRARRLWISSANFTRSSRHSLEFGFWTEDQSLLDGAERFLVLLMASSEGVDPVSGAFRPDLAPFEFDDGAMADYAAEFGWGVEDD